MCFPAIDYFEAKSVPFVVGVNNFDGAPRFDLDEVREALGVGAAVPVVDCDARNRESVKSSLITLLERLVAQVKSRPALACPVAAAHARGPSPRPPPARVAHLHRAPPSPAHPPGPD